MTIEIFDADQLYVTPGQLVTQLEGGGRRSEPGNQGVVFSGPHTYAASGVFRAAIDARVVGDIAGSAEFDISDPFADSRLYVSRSFESPFEVIVRVHETETLEFRFHTEGTAFELIAIRWEPLLLDAAAASPEQLETLARQVLDERGEPAAFFRLVDRLATLGEVEVAGQLRTAYVDRDADVATYVQSLLLQVHAPCGSRLADPRHGLRFSGAEILAEIWSREVRSFDLSGLTQSDRTELTSLGYKSSFLYATRHRREDDEPRRLWHECPVEAGMHGGFPPRQPLFERYPDIDRSYQASLARGDGIAAYDPVDGRLLRSQHGFLALYCDLPFVFYRFEGSEVFYLCTGHISSTKLFLYMPRNETVVIVCDPWYRNYDPLGLVRRLNEDLIRHRDLVGDYLASPTLPAAVVGSNIHGHYFWTDLTGLAYVLRNGLADGLAQIVRLRREFIDPLMVFPELAQKPAPFFSDPNEAARHCMANRLLPIHFTDIAMDASFVERIRQIAEQNASPAGHAPADAPRPLIWINLRAHNKIWLEQAEGFAQILNALYAQHGAVSAYVDGMPDCAPILREIRNKTRAEIPLYDGLHTNTFDTLSWAFQVDAYIAVIGSSLMIVNAMADGRGVAFGDHGHLHQMQWWGTVRSGLTLPLVPDQAEVVEEGEGLYTNYSLDWRVLLELLQLAMAGETAAQRSRAAPDFAPLEADLTARRLFTPDMPAFVASQEHRFDGSVLRIAPGLQGEFLRGPGVSAEAGVYRVTALGKALGRGAELFWAVHADGRVLAAQRFHEDGSLLAVLPKTDRLEFCFSALGAESLLEAVELEPLLLDAESITPAQAAQLQTQVQGLFGADRLAAHLERRLEQAALKDGVSPEGLKVAAQGV